MVWYVNNSEMIPKELIPPAENFGKCNIIFKDFFNSRSVTYPIKTIYPKEFLFFLMPHLPISTLKMNR